MLRPIGWWLASAPNYLRCGMDRLLDDAKQGPSILAAPPRPIAGQPAPHLLPLPSAEYIALVDWNGRKICADKEGAIPKDAPLAISPSLRS